MSRRVRVSLPLMAVLAILSMGSDCGGGGGGPPPCRTEGLTADQYAEEFGELPDASPGDQSNDPSYATGGGGEGGGGENCRQQ